MYLRMYVADCLIDELPVFPTLLPCVQHRELYVKRIVADLKKKHLALIVKFQISPVFFLEEIPSKMNTGEEDDSYLFTDLFTDVAIKN